MRGGCTLASQGGHLGCRGSLSVEDHRVLLELVLGALHEEFELLGSVFLFLGILKGLRERLELLREGVLQTRGAGLALSCLPLLWGWRLLDLEGVLLGRRVLLHPWRSNAIAVVHWP
jgi:hypothetical protein